MGIKNDLQKKKRKFYAWKKHLKKSNTLKYNKNTKGRVLNFLLRRNMNFSYAKCY